MKKEKNYSFCTKCETDITFFSDECWWENYGTYSAKYTKCPFCNSIVTLKYEDAIGLYINDDERYYQYKQRNN